MDNYRELLEKQMEEIDRLLNLSERNLKRLEQVEVKPVEIIKRNDKCYCYTVQSNRERKLIDKKDFIETKRIVQKKYEESINKKLRRMKKELCHFLDNYNERELLEVYDKYSEGRQVLVKPIIVPDNNYVKSWYEEHPRQQNNSFGEGQYSTERGEKVRSKSEKIIADMLYKKGIPYVYETALDLGYKTVYPDFMILDLKNRKTIIWEHLGIVSDMEYATKNFIKIEEYEENGFVLGKRFIYISRKYRKTIKSKTSEEKNRIHIRIKSYI